MAGRQVIAEGGYGEGLSWTFWAVRDMPREGDLLSMIRVTDSTGRMLHGGGVGGPPLDPGRLFNVRTSGSDEGPRTLLARADRGVRRMILFTEHEESVNVPLYDCEQIPEVRFACALLPRDVPLRSVAVFGDEGQELERFNLGFEQGQWEALERHRAGHTASLVARTAASYASYAPGAPGTSGPPAQSAVQRGREPATRRPDGRDEQRAGQRFRGAATARDW